MKLKFLVVIGISIGMIIAVALGIYLFRIVNDDFTGASKRNKVSEIVKNYLNNNDSEDTLRVQEILYNKAFNTFEVTVNNSDNSTFKIYVRKDLISLRDSRTEEIYNKKLNELLNAQFKSEVQELKSEVRVNVMTNNFSTRKDYFWITLIDSSDITKQEFQNVSLKILEWISKHDYKLDNLYLDFMNREFTGSKYSLKVDSSNYKDKDLTPYIKEEVTKK